MTTEMHLMTKKMHDVALTTAHQTVSMHVITIFTLIFLPGTFLAVSLLRLIFLGVALTGQTFFSSGILRWYEADELGDSKYTWATEHDRLLLYIEIAVPMMLFIVLGWLILFLKSRTGRSEGGEAEEPAELEKGLRRTSIDGHPRAAPGTTQLPNVLA